jgi:hypothetical protein
MAVLGLHAATAAEHEVRRRVAVRLVAKLVPACRAIGRLFLRQSEEQAQLEVGMIVDFLIDKLLLQKRSSFPRCSLPQSYRHVLLLYTQHLVGSV